MTFAIPVIGQPSVLLVRMLTACVTSITKFHRNAEVVLIGDGSITGICGREVLVGEPCPEAWHSMNYRADWVKAQAFRLIGKPVWVIDADMELRAPWPVLDLPAAQPYHYPKLEGSVYGMPSGVEFCSTLAAWWQSVDLFDRYKGFIHGRIPDYPVVTEQAACFATVAVGGSVVASPMILSPAPEGIAGIPGEFVKCWRDRPEVYHADHYISGLKQWRYK